MAGVLPGFGFANLAALSSTLAHASGMANKGWRGSHAICQGEKWLILQAAWQQLDNLLQVIDKYDFIIL
ncbi:hypothetical protein HNP46_004593 [Pseudomonas nitritireducens]|uniref:Uncharacterized protein n=1 Tax=Pseudomonas nitroreducens TaxID=46680 RepID=A0A7W7KMT9_PSENT|nr:hypothetical protein [Pseudomonas nitritireducens]MBB4865692.1 hypothetical protein [Pseudomonas nitritireducens]